MAFGPQSRGQFPSQFNTGTPPGIQSARFRPPYQPSPPPGMMPPSVSNNWPGSPSSQMQQARMAPQRMVNFMPQQDIKIPKPPKAPEKPVMPYMRYSRKVWDSVKAQYPELKFWEIGRIIGEMWRNLSDEDKKEFFDEYEVEKNEYQDALKEYQASPAYQQWLAAKGRAQAAIQEQQMMEKMIGGPVPKEEPRFQLQQVEEEDDEDAFTLKHVAAARFQRNHRLIAEVFSEAAVPDIKTIVTRPRLDNLKRQVQSLMQHQRKLEQEISEMEEKFKGRKRKIAEDRENFLEALKKFCAPVDEDTESEDGESTKDSETAETSEVASEG